MSAKRPPVIIATDSNSVKNKLLEKLVQLQMSPVSISPTELFNSPEQFLADQPAVVILDGCKTNHETILDNLKNLRRFALVRFIVLIDARNLAKFELKERDDTPFHPTIITSDPPLNELALAINYCKSMIELHASERGSRREHWAQKALHGLYQRTGDVEAMLAGIMGITATALNTTCAVISLSADHAIDSIMSHSGVKTDRLHLYWKRMPKNDLGEDVLGSFMSLKQIGPNRTTPPKNQNLFAPTTGLIMRITKSTTIPRFFCALGEPNYVFREGERRIFTQSALLASTIVEYILRSSGKELQTYKHPDHTTHQLEL